MLKRDPIPEVEDDVPVAGGQHQPEYRDGSQQPDHDRPVGTPAASARAPTGGCPAAMEPRSATQAGARHDEDAEEGRDRHGFGHTN